jgi:hypothetical protein
LQFRILCPFSADPVGFQQRRSDAVGIQAGCCDANMERVMTETKTRLVLLP